MISMDNEENEQEEIDEIGSQKNERKKDKVHVEQLRSLEKEVNRKQKSAVEQQPQPTLEQQAQVARLLEIAGRFQQLSVNDFGAVFNNDGEILLMPYNNSGLPLGVFVCNKNAIRKLVDIISRS